MKNECIPKGKFFKDFGPSCSLLMFSVSQIYSCQLEAVLVVHFLNFCNQPEKRKSQLTKWMELSSFNAWSMAIVKVWSVEITSVQCSVSQQLPVVAESMPVKNQNVMMRDTRRPCRNHSIAFVGTQHCNVRDDGGGCRKWHFIIFRLGYGGGREILVISRLAISHPQLSTDKFPSILIEQHEFCTRNCLPIDLFPEMLLRRLY